MNKENKTPSDANGLLILLSLFALNLIILLWDYIIVVLIIVLIAALALIIKSIIAESIRH
jgi:uncharacterized membrane protein